MTTKEDILRTRANRATALTALAAGEQKTSDGCLRSEEMAALVAGNLSGQDRQHCLDHLACCQSCYDEWRALATDEMAESSKNIKVSWFSKRSFSFTAAGSLLAAAASVILYLNLTPSPVLESQSPAPLVREREFPAETMSDEMQVSSEKAPLPLPLLKSKASRQESGLRAQKKAKKKEFVVGFEMDSPAAPPKKEDVAAQPMRSAINFEEEKIVEGRVASLPQEKEVMIDIGNVIPVVLKKMAQLEEGESLVLQTFKRDRSLTLIRLKNERILIREEGFFKEEFEVAASVLKKALKPLLKKEFPRSNKVRIIFGGRSPQK